jgi:hypothetical protein
MAVQDISIQVPNYEVPYFPSYSWGLTNSDFDVKNLYTFNWIQAFWDSNDLGVDPILVVSNGDTDSSGNLIVSAIQFAFSGQMINFKGKMILSSGDDRRGVTVTSLPINAAAPTTSFLKVIAYGGNY